jgi:hypothetical protein
VEACCLANGEGKVCGGGDCQAACTHIVMVQMMTLFTLLRRQRRAPLAVQSSLVFLGRRGGAAGGGGPRGWRGPQPFLLEERRGPAVLLSFC